MLFFCCLLLTAAARAHSEELQRTLMSQRGELDLEKARSEELLLNILPRSIAAKLKGGSSRIAEGHESVSIVFCDMPGFMEQAKGLSPTETVALLDELFSMMDQASLDHNIEKIKTIGLPFFFFCLHNML